MSLQRNMYAPGLNLHQLVADLSGWYQSRKFVVHTVGVAGNGVQMKCLRTGRWRSLLGLASSVDVTLHFHDPGLMSTAGSGLWGKIALFPAYIVFAMIAHRVLNAVTEASYYTLGDSSLWPIVLFYLAAHLALLLPFCTLTFGFWRQRRLPMKASQMVEKFIASQLRGLAPMAPQGRTFGPPVPKLQLPGLQPSPAPTDPNPRSVSISSPATNRVATPMMSGARSQPIHGPASGGLQTSTHSISNDSVLDDDFVPSAFSKRTSASVGHSNAPANPTRICRACGEPNPLDSKFCVTCGSRIANPTTSG